MTTRMTTMMMTTTIWRATATMTTSLLVASLETDMLLGLAAAAGAVAVVGSARSEGL
jgi:hypothetical protein